MGSRLLVVALLLALIIPLPAAGFNFSPSTPKPVPPFALEDGTGKTLSLADFLLDPAEIMSRPGATGRDAGTHREASRRQPDEHPGHVASAARPGRYRPRAWDPRA